LIRLLGRGLSGIGYSIEGVEVIAKDNKYQLIDSFPVTTQVQSSGVHGSRLENDEHTCPPDGRRGPI
jgi:hypothetical protein